MYLNNKNIQAESENIRKKLCSLNIQNNDLLKKWKREFGTSGKAVTKKTNKNFCESSQYVSKEEVSTTQFCHKKSLELIETFKQQKKLKKLNSSKPFYKRDYFYNSKGISNSSKSKPKSFVTCDKDLTSDSSGVLKLSYQNNKNCNRRCKENKSRYLWNNNSEEGVVTNILDENDIQVVVTPNFTNFNEVIVNNNLPDVYCIEFDHHNKADSSSSEVKSNFLDDSRNILNKKNKTLLTKINSLNSSKLLSSHNKSKNLQRRDKIKRKLREREEFVEKINVSASVCDKISKHKLNTKFSSQKSSNSDNSIDSDVIFLETINQRNGLKNVDNKKIDLSDVKNKNNKHNLSKFTNTIIDLVDDGEESDNILPEEINESSEEAIPIWNFEEEPIDFTLPRLHADEKFRMLSQEEIKALESEGVKIRTGRWSKEEKNLLRRNFENFTNEFGINDPQLLLGIGRQTAFNKYEFKNVKKFWKAKHFQARLGKDLNYRPLFSIFLKAKYDFNSLNKNPKCLSKDIPVLLKLQKKYGNRWHLIGQKSGRSNLYCQYICTNYKKATKHGKWTNEEVESLINAIKSVTKAKDIFFEDFKELPWCKIAELVPTRNASQCSVEWNLHQSLVRTRHKYPKWDQKCAAKLVYVLKNKYLLHSEFDIKWSDVYKSHFKNTLPSCTILRHKWHCLKKYVPNLIKVNFTDLLNFLFKKYSNLL